MFRMSLKVRWLIAGMAFATCIAPTIVSYQPYAFRWDDSDYLLKSISVSRAFWAGHSTGRDHIQEIVDAMYSIRPPAMSLLGLPWGAMRSWDAVGYCFVTLGSWISLVAALCLFLLTRTGVKPLFLVVASICVSAALGPWPAHGQVHEDATSLMADTLFAWTSLAAVLLVHWEARKNDSQWHAALRGILWGVVLSLGAMTKISFLYFVALILPTLLVIRWVQSGLINCGSALVGFLMGAGPAIIYLKRYGRASLTYAGQSSFGSVADLYKTSFVRFVQMYLHKAPGLWFLAACSIGACLYIVLKRRSNVVPADVIAILISIGFAMIVLYSPNREFRFMFGPVVSLPFQLAILASSGRESISRRWSAATAAVAFVFLVLAVLPMRFRAMRSASLVRADAVVAHAIRCGASKLLIATDSTTLNDRLVQVAVALPERAARIQVDTMQDSILSNVPIDRDLEAIRQSDEVVFQDNPRNDTSAFPPFTNGRTMDYKRYAEQRGDLAPSRVGSDVTVFSKSCRAELPVEQKAAVAGSALRGAKGE
jgi:hypothetical protein